MFGPPITAATLAAGPASTGRDDPSGRHEIARSPKGLTLTHAEGQKLIRWARSGTVPQRVALRARIALLLAAGHPPRSVARMLGVGVNTVSRWKERVGRAGIEALTRDAPGRGRKRVVRPAWEPVLRDMLATPPLCGCRWTVRGLAKALGWSTTTTARRMQELRRR